MRTCYHAWYNRQRFPYLVVNHGNHDIYSDATGYCAAIPSAEGRRIGCRASHFGDLQYVRATLRVSVAHVLPFIASKARA